ncbi:MAG TPA: hypothetical protein VET88_11815 [Gammaproteobacteria bacterium]|nr:hypothetical protein [Gammaproteobacteria bacterium]
MPNLEEVIEQLETIEAQITENNKAGFALERQMQETEDKEGKEYLAMAEEMAELNAQGKELAPKYLALADMRGELKAKQAQHDAAKESLHNNAPGVPDLKQQLDDLETMMNSAANAENMSDYMALKAQRKAFIAKHGNVNRTVITHSSESHSRQQDRIRAAKSTLTVNNPSASIEERMAAAANSGDMATYRRLRAERRAAV